MRVCQRYGRYGRSTYRYPFETLLPSTKRGDQRVAGVDIDLHQKKRPPPLRYIHGFCRIVGQVSDQSLVQCSPNVKSIGLTKRRDFRTSDQEDVDYVSGGQADVGPIQGAQYESNQG